MSEEKMYAVMNRDGKYCSFDVDGFWQLDGVVFPFTVSAAAVKNMVEDCGGHIVALVEEPKKVVLTKEQAETVEKAHTISYPAYYISVISGKDEELLMNAYVNGYTVEKEKRYVLPIPGTDHYNNLMHENIQYYAVKGSGGNWRADLIALDTDDAIKNGYTVNQSDIDTAPAWVKAITPVEVTDEQ